MKRCTWNRARYRRAHHLSRLLSRFDHLSERPDIVRRFHELWERHQAKPDPLATPLRRRLEEFRGGDDGVPF